LGVGDVSTFGKAWRKKTRRRVAAQIGLADDTGELLALDDVTRRLRMFEQSYLGVRAIPVGSIVGTVDKRGDFDRDFLPRRSAMEGRWGRVEEVVQRGDMPPIEVYEIEGRYFLVDGHHRVAVARQLGIDYIDAEITRIRTRYPFPVGADLGQVIHSQAKHVFLEESGLDRAVPEARIECSAPVGYVELLEQVKVHGYDLVRRLGRVVPQGEVAAHWYDRVYRPTIEAIREHGLPGLLENEADGDLFLAIHRRMRFLQYEQEDSSYEATVRLATEEARPRRRKSTETLKAIADLSPKRASD
jgi:hypothetical protein